MSNIDLETYLLKIAPDVSVLDLMEKHYAQYGVNKKTDDVYKDVFFYNQECSLNKITADNNNWKNYVSFYKLPFLRGMLRVDGFNNDDFFLVPVSTFDGFTKNTIPNSDEAEKYLNNVDLKDSNVIYNDGLDVLIYIYNEPVYIVTTDMDLEYLNIKGVAF